MTQPEFKKSFSRMAGLTRLPGLAEGMKDEAYREGMAAGQAVVHVVQMGWAKAPKDGDKAGWMKIVDKYAGVQEFSKDPAWLKGFKSALTGHYGKEVKLEATESKGFHHGTVRQWKNGRHMKNGGGWERVKSGRSMPMASKVPSFTDAPMGAIPAGVWEDPNDFSRQAIPTRDMSAAIVNAVAGRDIFAVGEALELYARVLEGETLDEGALAKMKMIFGKLLKVGEKPKVAPAKGGVLAINPVQKAREAESQRRKNKAASIARGER